MLTYIWLIVGFVLLIKGADLFVDGSSSVAKILKVPSVIIGLTIVSLGTSAPEAAVSISAAFNGNNDIALSNVVGSNIFNLLVVIGVSAIITPFLVDKDIKKRDLPINILLTTILLIFVYTGKTISRVEGIALIIMTIIYIVILVKNALKNKVEEKDEGKVLSVPMSIFFIIIGLAAIIFGGNKVVESATQIAKDLHVSDLLIGLTIVALGTSLPELVTSVVAAKKGESGLALGNAVGSSILNIIFILGVSSTVSPIAITVSREFQFILIDIFVLILVSMVIQVFCITREKVSRFEGVFCTLAYVAYTVYIILRTVIK